jgi:hypothetical protein
VKGYGPLGRLALKANYTTTQGPGALDWHVSILCAIGLRYSANLCRVACQCVGVVAAVIGLVSGREVALAGFVT